MEQHPIPQNITGFEFKLIGDMTIKQFAYLAGCAILAYLTFVSPLYPLIKLPLAIFFALLGVGLAFIPVEGRPLDRWIINFIRALFSPSQYIFHKEERAPEFLNVYTPTNQVSPAKVKTNVAARNDQFADYLQTVSNPQPLSDEEEQKRLHVIEEAFNMPLPVSQPTTPPQEAIPPGQRPSGPVAPPTPPPLQPIIQVTDLQIDPQVEDTLKKKEELEKENEKLKNELDAIKEKLDKLASQKETIQKPSLSTQQQIMDQALAIEKKLQEALSEKERLISELSTLKRENETSKTLEAVKPSDYPLPKVSEKVKIIPPELQALVGVAGFPQAPNIVSGIVKDAKGEVLPNIIVEVKDAGGTPVRAFKTNKLGQFSAATTLSNGKYTIELEDPKNTYTFDVVEIELTGNVFAPLEITVKDQAQNERQQLYQTLFGARNG